MQKCPRRKTFRTGVVWPYGGSPWVTSSRAHEDARGVTAARPPRLAPG
jgi:hypothetical protein